MSNNLVMGILAHVDAGKTTLAENLLYLTGSIRKMGRVDHKDAFLDTNEMERARGITIFSKQALFTLGEKNVTLLDTPGHVDFSAEMERTLQVLDYAILVISGADGVTGHDMTLWHLLKRYHIPAFVFVNKMDQVGSKKEELLAEIAQQLDDRCIDFGRIDDTFYENLAMSEEALLDSYLETGEIAQADIVRLIAERKVFPCFFGSALRSEGVKELIGGLETYMMTPVYPQEFGARVFKITRDAQGNRLTHLKVTGGTLAVKMLLSTRDDEGEKVDQIRFYNGTAFRTDAQASAGMVCAVCGLEKTYSGQGLGLEAQAQQPILEPVLTYRLELPPGCDVHKTYLQLLQLEEEEPQLHMVWDAQAGEIRVQVMGEVQIEILKHQMQDRFHIQAEFGSGSIVYKETLASPVEGVGHYEPLRHYAEVHLIMQPLPAGSGLQFDAECSEDVLDRNWQRLILTHLEEKMHRGVLTGSEITDMRITLVNGKAHLKHTEGGDFRQATYRAVRQGLKMGDSVLLEPIYRFRLEVPTENIGRAMNDMNQMHGEFSSPQLEGEMSILTGTVPAATAQDYQREVTSYTRGRGRFFCTLDGYAPCHNAQEVIEAIGYDSESDLENPTGSVFCSHGAGFVVDWDQVPAFMHLEGILYRRVSVQEEEIRTVHHVQREAGMSGAIGDKELEEIFTRTYGSGKEGRSGWGRSRFQSSYGQSAPVGLSKSRRVEPMEEYLLVDGYNIIFAWEELAELAKVNIESARGKLMDILSNYQGYRSNHLILVFDAYKVEGGVGEVLKYHNIHVIYTKEAETADQYIEKTVREMVKKYHVTVATSDLLEQRIIWGEGAARMSAKELQDEIALMEKDIRENWLDRPMQAAAVDKKPQNEEEQEKQGTGLFRNLPADVVKRLEEMRLGKRTWEEV